MGLKRVIQGLSRPLIGENRHIIIILRFTIINQEEAKSVVEGKSILV